MTGDRGRRGGGEGERIARLEDVVKTSKPALVFILVTLALDVLGFGLLIPVAPELVERLLHGGRGGTEAEAAPYVGSLQATFYMMAFLFSPLLGVISDKVGRRPVILISLFGSGLDYLAMALAPSVGWLFVTRVVNGLTGASFSVASAYIADVTVKDKRAAAFGMMGAAFGVGFVLGPVIGGVLGDIDIRLPFYVAGGLTLVNWMYGYFVLPESLAAERRAPLRMERANPLGAFYALTKYPLVMGLAVALFLLNMAQFALHATWALYTEHRYGWTPEEIGYSLAVVGIGAMVVQGGLAGVIVKKIGEKRALLLGVAMGVMAYVGYGSATEGWMIYVIVGAASLGAVSQPASQSLITRTVHMDEQGAVQGALASLTSLAGVAGPIIGSYVLAKFIGEQAPFPTCPIDLQGMNFYVSAAIAAMGLGAAWWAVRRGSGEKEKDPGPKTEV